MTGTGGALSSARQILWLVPLICMVFAAQAIADFEQRKEYRDDPIKRRQAEKQRKSEAQLQNAVQQGDKLYSDLTQEEEPGFLWRYRWELGVGVPAVIGAAILWRRSLKGPKKTKRERSRRPDVAAPSTVIMAKVYDTPRQTTASTDPGKAEGG